MDNEGTTTQQNQRKESGKGATAFTQLQNKILSIGGSNANFIKHLGHLFHDNIGDLCTVSLLYGVNRSVGETMT